MTATFSDRKAAILAHVKANPPVAEARIDFSALMNGAVFTPPAQPALTAGMTSGQIAAARLASVWIRPQLVASRNSGKPLHRGASSPTMRRGGVLTAVFAPAGHGDDYGIAGVVRAVERLFHRQFVGTARFGDCDEPEVIVPPSGAKFEQTNVFNPFLAIDDLVAD